jgi:hypothetical protein
MSFYIRNDLYTVKSKELEVKKFLPSLPAWHSTAVSEEKGKNARSDRCLQYRPVLKTGAHRF